MGVESGASICIRDFEIMRCEAPEFCLLFVSSAPFAEMTLPHFAQLCPNSRSLAEKGCQYPCFCGIIKCQCIFEFKYKKVFMKGSEDMDNGPTPIRKRILLMILKPSLASQDR